MIHVTLDMYFISEIKTTITIIILFLPQIEI